MSDIDARVRAAFQVEYPEHVRQIRAVVSAIEGGGQPPRAEFEKVLRHAHNLKGAARAVDLLNVEGLAHRLEAVFALALRGTLTLDRAGAHVIHGVLDAVEDCCTATAAADPARSQMALDHLLAGTVAPEPRSPEEAVVGAVPEDTVRIPIDRLDRLLGSVGEVLSSGPTQDALRQEIGALHTTVQALTQAWRRRRTGAGTEAVDAALHSLSGQMARVQRLQADGMWTLERDGRRLHADVRRVLMVPARSVFEGFPRLMRDLARDLGKPLDFVMEGIDIQADRRILQALKDPLVHLLRNAAHHAIETAPERSAGGKPVEGRVVLRLQARGTRLTVSVEDDGRGIDYARVAQTAVRQGLVTEASAATLAPGDLARLLFRPGFSTATAVTAVAGRGIGLSVVEEAMTVLQGEVQAHDRPGGGTVFVLSVPLAMSLQRLLRVDCQGQSFAIPLSGIERLYRIPVAELRNIEGRPYMTAANGADIPVWSLAHLLYRDDSSPPGHAVMAVAVLRAGSRRLAVAVDALLGQVEGVVKTLGPVHPAGLRAQGGLILGDGSVCLMLSPADLMEMAREAVPTRLAPASSPPVVAPEPRGSGCVLVVDDSFTTRTLEKGILESYGYRVRVAVDGLEGLQVVRRGGIDLIIADVEMPRLDGFGLLEALKADAELASIPVILVTSCDRREDQERGLSLGADAYIVKRQFTQRELLETVEQLL